MALSRNTGREPGTNPFTSAANFTTARTTGAFTPSAGDTLFIIVDVGTGVSAAVVTVTDNHSNTFTKLVSQSAGAGNYSGVFWHQYSSAPGSTTITAQATSSTAGGMIMVLNYSGAAATQTGATVQTDRSGGAGALSGALNAASGSVVVGGAANWDDTTTLAVVANTTSAGAFIDSTNGDSYGSFTSTTVGSSLTYGYSTSKHGSMVAAEVQAAAGGTNYTPTQDDPVGITDAVLAGQDNTRTLTDPVGVTDSASAAQGTARTQNDAVGISDAVTAVSGPTRTQTDPVGVTDLLAAAQAFARSIADPVGLSDALSPAQALARQQADAVGITDSVSAVITGGGSSYTGFGGADPGSTYGADGSSYNMGTEFYTTLSGQTATGGRFWVPTGATGTGSGIQFFLCAVDATLITGTGFPTGSILAQSNPSSSVTAGAWNELPFVTPYALAANTYYEVFVYTPGGQYGFLATIFGGGTDVAAPSGASGLFFAHSAGNTKNGNYVVSGTPGTLPNTDNGNGTWYGIDLTLSGATGTDYTKTQDDLVGVTDALAAALDAARAVTDPIGLTDALAVTQGISRAVSDPENITDALTPAQALARAQSDAVGITDSLTGAISAHNYAVTINDPIGITDLGSQQAIDYAVVLDPEPIGITDAVTVGQALPRTQSDPIGVTDSAATAAGNARTTSDPIGIVDDLTATLTGGGTSVTSDPVGITDQLTATQDAVRAQSDPVGLTDATAATQANARAVTDPVGISDDITALLTPAGQAIIADPVGITDQATVAQANTRQVDDPVGVTDSLASAAAFLRALADSIGLTDSVAASLGLLRTLSDQVGISDLLTASLVHTPVNYVVVITDAIGVTDLASAPAPASSIRYPVTGSPGPALTGPVTGAAGPAYPVTGGTRTITYPVTGGTL